MNPSDTPAPRFAAAIGRRLRRRGFIGDRATVALAGGGWLAVPFAEIERQRVGFA